MTPPRIYSNTANETNSVRLSEPTTSRINKPLQSQAIHYTEGQNTRVEMREASEGEVRDESVWMS